MFKDFNKLHTPEWLKIIQPYGLVDKIISFLRVLLSSIIPISSDALRIKYAVYREGYSVVIFKASDVIYVENKLIAGKGINTTEYKWQVRNNSRAFEMLGCGYTENIAVRNMDYKFENGVYWFKQHPSMYSYAYIEGDETVYYTVGFCADYVRSAQSFKPTSASYLTPKDAIAYENSIYNSNNGINNAISLYLKGISTTNGLHGKVKYHWAEQGYNFVITDTDNFIALPTEVKATIKEGSVVQIDETPSAYFHVELEGDYLPVSIGWNNKTDYPSIERYYPVTINAQNQFSGEELYKILIKRGCNFLEIPYINNYEINNDLIKAFNIQGERIIYIGEYLADVAINNTNIEPLEWSSKVDLISIRYSF